MRERFEQKSERVASVSSKAESARMREAFEAANEHRDYSIYTQSMDAAQEAKARSIFPYFNIEEGDIIVDAGSGTGAIAELAAREFRGARVFALDISHELQERAQEQKALSRLRYGNATERNFPDNSIKVKYYSTSGHEIESFGGLGSMRKAMEHTFLELVPGGRVIVRDFAKPSRNEPLYMLVLSNAGIEKISEEMPSENIDYNLLSASALLECFRKEFRGGGKFSFEKTIIQGKEYIKIDPEWAHEFYLRKDYTANWRQEIKEKYTYWTPEEAKQTLEELGYVNVRVIPDPNEWILKNRLEGKIELYEMTKNGLQYVPFPMSHMVVVGEKPLFNGENLPKKKEEEVLREGVNYRKILSSIEINEEDQIVKIGTREFRITKAPPLIGTKKLVFCLEGVPLRILKVVRSDTKNDHNVFKSMFQVIERQQILERHKTPYLKITEYDEEGPPFRYVVQEGLPENGQCAADLIQNGDLREEDIEQMAGIINRYEKGKEWQIDTNPFGWFRMPKNDGSTQMVYVSGKVYRYDERWEFKKVGLLQWLDPSYVERQQNFSAAIPTEKDRERLNSRWEEGGKYIDWWKAYLDPSLL